MGFSQFTDIKDIDDQYEFPNKCDNSECACMTENGCKFEYCIFEEFPALEADESTYICEVCGEPFDRDNKKITHHICDECINKIKKSVKRSSDSFDCKICEEHQSGKESEIPESDICDKCFRELVRYVLQARDLYDEDEFIKKWGPDE